MFFHRKPKVDPLQAEPVVCSITQADVDRADKRYHEAMEAANNIKAKEEMKKIGRELEAEIEEL